MLHDIILHELVVMLLPDKEALRTNSRGGFAIRAGLSQVSGQRQK